MSSSGTSGPSSFKAVGSNGADSWPAMIVTDAGTVSSLVSLELSVTDQVRAGLVVRLRVPNTGSMVELSSKFGCDPGEAVDLIAASRTFEANLAVLKSARSLAMQSLAIGKRT
mgnify:CR=1 FL=1